MVPNIAIVGAGPAGCTLARLLHLANIPCTVFEGETALEGRSQGSTLDLHSESGLAALKECGLYNEFLKFARYDGEAMVFCDKDFRIYVSKDGKNGESKWGRPEIDRIRLREILLASLPDGMVKWGQRLRSLSEEDGKYVLNFEQGQGTGFDLIVGADGAFSKIRPVLTDDKPEYSGIGTIWSKIPDLAETYPDLYQLLNRGSLFSFSDGKNIIAQQLGDGSAIVSLAWVCPENWLEESQLDLKSGEAVKRYLTEKFKDWDPRLLKFIDVMDSGDIMARNFYMLPVGNRWKNRRGVTLIGDAAHLMTPYAGEGVNLAMTDSMKLAHAIIAASRDAGTGGGQDVLTEEVKKFEEDMFGRAMKFQQMTYDMMHAALMDPGAPYSTIEKYAVTAVAHDLPWVVRPFVVCVIYVYFWVKKTFFLSIHR